MTDYIDIQRIIDRAQDLSPAMHLRLTYQRLKAKNKKLEEILIPQEAKLSALQAKLENILIKLDIMSRK